MGCLEQTEADGKGEEADGGQDGWAEVAGSAATAAVSIVAIVVIVPVAIAVSIATAVVVVIVVVVVAITIAVVVAVAISRAAVIIIIIVVTTATITITATATTVIIIIIVIAATTAVAVGLVGFNWLLRLDTGDARNTAVVTELVDILLGATQVGLSNADFIVDLVVDNVGRAKEGVAEENETAVPDSKLRGRGEAEHADLVEFAEITTVSGISLQRLLFQIGEGVDDHLPHGDSDDLAVKFKVKRVVLAPVAGPCAVSEAGKRARDRDNAKSVEDVPDGRVGHDRNGRARVEDSSSTARQARAYLALATGDVDGKVIEADGVVRDHFTGAGAGIWDNGEDGEVTDVLVGVNGTKQDAARIRQDIVLRWRLATSLEPLIVRQPTRYMLKAWVPMMPCETMLSRMVGYFSAEATLSL